MTYPRPFLRLVVSGSLFTIEGFSYSLSLIPDDAGTGSPPTEVPASVVTAVSTFHTAVSEISAKVDLIKLNEIGVDGRYTSDTTVLHEPATPIASSTTATKPAQIALAVSLETGARRGLAARGRFYIPAPKGGISSDGLIPDGAVTPTLTAATAFLDALNDAVPGYRVGVASDIGAGRFREVRNVRIGRVLDTIRSRRSSLPESYLEGAVLSTFSGGGGSF